MWIVKIGEVYLVHIEVCVVHERLYVQCIRTGAEEPAHPVQDTLHLLQPVTHHTPTATQRFGC